MTRSGVHLRRRYCDYIRSTWGKHSCGHNLLGLLTGTYLYLWWHSSTLGWAAITISRLKAFQSRQSCANSLETFTQSFLHCPEPKTCCPERGFRSAMIVITNVYSCSPVCLRHVQGDVPRAMTFLRGVLQRDWTSGGGFAVPRMARNHCAPRVEYDACCP